MTRSIFLPFLVFLLSASPFCRAELWPEDEDGRRLVQEARRRVLAWHGAEAGSASNVIRVVYFHPADRPPLPDWRARAGRILADVSGFYRDGMDRLGAGPTPLPFECDPDGFVIHRVRGQHSADQYDYDSGDATEREVRDALSPDIDLDRAYLLILHGLSHQEEDGRYVFNAPYYGRGDQRSGLCHAADCELLDPELLTATDRTMVYTEHYYPRKKQSLAEFNTWYLGGIAHELGHGLGLPHDAGCPWERSWSQASLMGMGNHHYRSDRWGGSTPAYLSQATALRLLSHPTFTQSDKGRWTDPQSELTDLVFAYEEEALVVKGKVAGRIPAYAVTAYLWQPSSWPGNPSADHHSITVPVLVEQGTFSCRVVGFRPGDARLRLTAQHCNGAARNVDTHVQTDRSGRPNIELLNAAVRLVSVEAAVRAGDLKDAQAGLSDETLRAVPEGMVRDKLGILRDLVDPPEPIDLGLTIAKSVSLSDAKWEKATVGWGRVSRNCYDLDQSRRNSIYLELDGRVYAKGLYAHSASEFAFDLDGRWKRFSATVGLRDGAASQGSAVFRVVGDGKELFRSAMLRAGAQASLEVQVSGVKRLELLADGGEGHVHNSWAIWVDPIVTR